MSTANKNSLEEEAIELVRAETRYLNNTDLDNWIALFSEDGYYWMPLEEEHTDPEAHDSLIYDNRTLMAMRKYNLGNPLSPSMQHKVRSVRVLTDLELDESNYESRELTATAYVIAVLYHKQKNYYAGRVTYQFVKLDEGLKIRVKRVDLLDADAPLDSIMMYI